MRFFFSIVFLFLGFLSRAQCDTSRYTTAIFDSVIKHANVQYGSAQVWNIPYNNTDLFMDIYEPANDTVSNRPLMIWVHPGGFLLGDKEADDMVALCDSFARKGFVTASIGYRLGFNPLSASSAVRAVYRGTQDTRAAIRFLKEFASTYGIDTNFTFLGGSSAGAFATLHTAYLTDNEAPSDIQGGFGYPALGCLDCSGNNYTHNMDLTGIIGLWGALGDSNYIQPNETVPALLIHGEADGVVPIGTGNPFGVFTTPVVNGSRPISNQLIALGIPHTFMPFDSLDHEFHGADNGTFNNPPNAYWDTILDAIQNHVYPLLKPNPPTITGDFSVCLGDTAVYSFVGGSMDDFCFQLINGTVLSVWDDSVQVVWNTLGNANIEIRAINSIQAVSSSISQEIQIHALPDASFTFSNVGGTLYDFTPVNVAQGNSYLWNFAGLGSSTSTAPNFDFLGSGTFTVALSVLDSNLCSNTTSQNLTITLSLLEMGENLEVKLYPNPANNHLFLEMPIGSEVAFIDGVGKVIKEISTTNKMTEMDISNLSKGVYQLRVSSLGQILRKQLIIQ